MTPADDITAVERCAAALRTAGFGGMARELETGDESATVLAARLSGFGGAEGDGLTHEETVALAFLDALAADEHAAVTTPCEAASVSPGATTAKTIPAAIEPGLDEAVLSSRREHAAMVRLAVDAQDDETTVDAVRRAAARRLVGQFYRVRFDASAIGGTLNARTLGEARRMARDVRLWDGFRSVRIFCVRVWTKRK